MYQKFYGDELPLHQVCLDGFYLGRHEVTVGQFKIFTKATGFKSTSKQGYGCYTYKIPRYKWMITPGASWQTPGFAQTDQNPVVCVSWHEAAAFAEWMSSQSGGNTFRLPTEAEWEYTARNGGKSHDIYSGGEKIAKLGWYVENSNRITHKVGLKTPNAKNIYDMSGNVWE